MDEIDKLLEHVTANCDQIIDGIKQDETRDADPDEINTDSMSADDILKMMGADDFEKDVNKFIQSIHDDDFDDDDDDDLIIKTGDDSEDEDEDEKWLQDAFEPEEQSDTPPLTDVKQLEHIVSQMMDEAREIDDTIMEMIADGEIELYRNEDNVVMMKLTELGLKRHEEDQQNEQ